MSKLNKHLKILAWFRRFGEWASCGQINQEYPTMAFSQIVDLHLGEFLETKLTDGLIFYKITEKGIKYLEEGK